jgi:hypothetical protein
MRSGLQRNSARPVSLLANGWDLSRWGRDLHRAHDLWQGTITRDSDAVDLIGFALILEEEGNAPAALQLVEQARELARRQFDGDDYVLDLHGAMYTLQPDLDE